MIVPLPGYGDVELNLATCSYKAFDPSMGVPVRTSVGYPRFWRKTAPALEYVPELAPFGKVDGVDLRKIDDRAVFDVHYRARLAANGVTIVEKVVDLSRGREGIPLVFLCYEDVHDPTTFCHRTTAGLWLHEQLGLDVPELSPAPHSALFS